jgi:hypothetical protein
MMHAPDLTAAMVRFREDDLRGAAARRRAEAMARRPPPVGPSRSRGILVALLGLRPKASSARTASRAPSGSASP